MVLGLDLSASDAKIARARVHFKALQGELDTIRRERKPYSTRLSEINEDTGCLSLYLTPRDLKEYGFSLGVIVGDIIHNLRCALDYIVAGLVGSSGGTVGKKHQFPIFTDQTEYTKRVGTDKSFVADGPLDGIAYGLAEIWNAQPFQHKVNSIADPLFHVYRFSNADKHRIIADFMPIPDTGDSEITHNGVLLEQVVVPRKHWEPNREQEIIRFCFARPYPTEAYTDSNYTVRIFFGTTPFGKDPSGHGVEVGILEQTCDHVAMVTNRFKAL